LDGDPEHRQVAVENLRAIRATTGRAGAKKLYHNLENSSPYLPGWVATESDKQDNSIMLFRSAASEGLCEYVTSLFESSVDLQYEGNFWSREKLLVLPQYKKTTEVDLNEAQGQQSVWRRVDRTLRVLLNK
jgi:hypothetical protein